MKNVRHELGKDNLVLNIVNKFDKVLIKITLLNVETVHHRYCHFSSTKDNNT